MRWRIAVSALMCTLVFGLPSLSAEATPTAIPRANSNTIWWNLCKMDMPNNYAVNNYPYRFDIERLMMYCGNHGTRPQYGVRHATAKHAHEYQFAVD